MDVTNVNKPLLFVEYNNEDNKWHWRIGLNEKDSLFVSPIGFETEKECRLSLITLDYCVRYLRVSGELDKF